MFNFFKKSEPQKEVLVSEMPTKGKYPKVVEDIHNEFFTAGDNILQEATCLLKELEIKDLAKGKRLAALGFSKTREAVVAIETENKVATTKEIADLVMYYRINYPNNKFITEEQVKQICKKYGLICGDISMYKGFVPEKKLNQIEKFNLRSTDNYCEWFIPGIGNTRNKNKLTGMVGVKTIFDSSVLKICAPLKDMEIPDTKELKGYKIQDKPVPDPVVLQPIKGGYLILAAWGDEASDEIVVNQINN